MTTIPDVPLEGHLQNLVSLLQRWFPDLSIDSLAFYDVNACFSSDGFWCIKQNDIMKQNRFSYFFEELCDNGCEWINLSGDGWFENDFLVSVEYSSRPGFGKTGIVLSGPALDKDHRPLGYTRFKVVG